MENQELHKTATGRITVVGTRKCSNCGRQEFHTKKYEASGKPEDLNQRYSLCKGLCVYCYNKPQAQGGHRKAAEGTAMTEEQLRAKIAALQALLPKETPE